MEKSRGESAYSVSIGVLAQLERYLSHMKVDTDLFFNSLGFDSAILACPDERISVETYSRIEDEAAEMTGNPHFGLHMGQFAETGNWSILGYMMMNCKTIGQAFEKYAKYSDIIGNVIKGEYHNSHNAITITLSVPSDAPEISQHCYEGYLSSIISLARSLSGQKIDPIKVGIAFPEPDSIKEYSRIFNCPVVFNQRSNYMIVDAKVMSTPVLLPNDNLLRYFENYAREFLEGIEKSQSITYTVKKLILSNMDNDKLTLSFAAKELCMGVRTLQARLKSEGTEFSKLVRDTREQLAKKYLKEDYTVEDITYLLGFSDPSVFRKAFKKWSGYTPKEYRSCTA